MSVNIRGEASSINALQAKSYELDVKDEQIAVYVKQLYVKTHDNLRSTNHVVVIEERRATLKRHRT